MTMTANAPTTTQPHAGGRLVAHDGRELPLRAVHLSTRAAGGIARVVLTQTFQNPFPEAIEVRYLVPLPSEGAVSGFSFLLGDTRVEGVVTGKQEARQRFERALVQGKTAALLEQDRTSLFTQRVGNVPPGSEIVCELVIDQALRWLEEGCWEWRFPTVVAPRYQGAPGRVADADALQVPVSQSSATGGAGLGVRASLALTIGDGLTGAVTSPSHAIQARGSDLTEVRLEGAGTRLDRDLVVRWPIALPEVSAAVIPARPAAEVHGGDTFALLTVAPPTGGGVSVARDLTFLIDTSGSMGGRPLDQAQQVVSAMLETLGPNDRIELIEFGSRPKRFKRKPVAATPSNTKAALKWVRALRSSGCTEMHRAVMEALAPLRPDSQRQVILITDGYIGFEAEIVATLLRELPDGARLHTIGVGSSVNRTLTQGAARAGRGTELLIGLDEDPQTLVGRFLAKTSAPLVTDIVVSGPGVIEIAPRQLPDLYAESPALFAARLGPEGGTVVISGRTAQGRFEQRLEVPALALGEGHEGVVALFGREKVEDLEMTLSAGGGVAEINSAIEATGIDFQISTRLTSWVAVSKKATVATRERPTTVAQPHELPAGVSAEGLGLRKPRRTSLSGKKQGRLAAIKKPAPAKWKDAAPAEAKPIADKEKGYLSNEEARRLYDAGDISLEEVFQRVEDPEELKMPLRGIAPGAKATEFPMNFGGEDVDERTKLEESSASLALPAEPEPMLGGGFDDEALDEDIEVGAEFMEDDLELIDEGATIVLADSDSKLGIAGVGDELILEDSTSDSVIHIADIAGGARSGSQQEIVFDTPDELSADEEEEGADGGAVFGRQSVLDVIDGLTGGRSRKKASREDSSLSEADVPPPIEVWADLEPEQGLAASGPPSSAGAGAPPPSPSNAEGIVRRITTKRVLPPEQQVAGKQQRARKSKAHPLKIVLLVLAFLLGVLAFVFWPFGGASDAPSGKSGSEGGTPHKSAPASPGVGGK